MPVVTLAIPQSQDTITRNVVRSVVGDLIVLSNLPNDTDVIYTEDLGGPATIGGTINSTPDVRLSQDNHVIIGYEEKYLDTGVLTGHLQRVEYPYIFRDSSIGILIKPTCAVIRMTATVKYVFRDRSSLQKYKRIMRMMHSQGVLANNHTLRYEYSMHDDILAFLYDVYAMREPINGVKESYNDYLNRCFNRGLGRRSNQSGTRHRLVLDEMQGNIIGRYEDEMFYNESTAEEGNHSIEFAYTFDYAQVTATVMQYPNVIHNKKIPRAYRKAWATNDIPDFHETALHTLSALPPLWRFRVGKYYRGVGGFKIDPTDEWEPQTRTPNTRSILLSPLMVDETDPTLLVNINDFSAEQLPVEIRDYLLDYPSESLELHKTPYLIQAFSVGVNEIETTLTMNALGEVRSVLPLDKLRRHYLRISMMTDLSRLPITHITEMLDNPARTIGVMVFLNDNVVFHGDVPELRYHTPPPDPSKPLPPIPIKTPDVVGAISKISFTDGKLTLDGSIKAPDNTPVIDTKSVYLKVIGSRRITMNSFKAALKNMPTSNREYAALQERGPMYNLAINPKVRKRYQLK